MNISQLTPDQKRTILTKKLPGVIRCHEIYFGWQFCGEHGWEKCRLNDPLLDANAAQAMEQQFHANSDRAYRYYRTLENIVYKTKHSGTGIEFQVLNATPTQRFDAFLSLLPEA